MANLTKLLETNHLLFIEFKQLFISF
jgi:hypothetical protein